MNRDVHLRLNLLNFLLNPMPKDTMEKSHKQTNRPSLGRSLFAKVMLPKLGVFLSQVLDSHYQSFDRWLLSSSDKNIQEALLIKHKKKHGF